MPTQIRTAQIQDLAITNLKQNFGTPSAGTDVAIKSYTDTAISNAIGLLNLKDKVIVATTVNGALATAYANAQVVDGYALVTGDRILLKNQTAGAENGIYTVNATGAPTRSTDTDTAAKIQDAFVGVQRGTANADTQWKMVTDPPLTIGTTALVWTQQGSAGLTSGNFIFRETPAGTINSSNVSFTLAFTPTAGTETIYLNGIEQNLTTDYTISGLTITYAVAPVTGDILRVSYLK